MAWRQDAREEGRRMLSARRADWLAAGALACVCGLWTLLTWGRLSDPIIDQGWYLQVSARAASGDVLYRDMLWVYGPLPVQVLAWLFQRLGTQVSTFLLLSHALTALGCLLTYAVARFLLKPPLALLTTLAVFLGGWWGGLVGYTFSYTGAVPLGAVLGLLFAFALLSYLQSQGSVWLAVAGLASGGATLCKPEFALACLGTGTIILTAVALLRARAVGGGRAWRALAVYVISSAVVIAAGLSVLIHQAGWAAVMEGYSGYDQSAILLREWPPWGTRESWCYIASGLGLCVLAGLGLFCAVAPRAARRNRLAAAALGGLGLVLTLLPWREIQRIHPQLVPGMLASRAAFIQEAIRVIGSPTTLLLSAGLIWAGVRWWRAYRSREAMGEFELCLAALALYSALAALRSFLYPTGTFHFMYLDTAAPVLVFAASVLIPRAMPQEVGAGTARATLLIAGALLVYAGAGLMWDVDYMATMDTPWVTLRGSVLFPTSSERRQAWPELLRYLLDHTAPDDAIAILGHEAGFYFWTGRTNPLRHDSLLPGMATGPADAEEIVGRLDHQRPAWVIIPQSVPGGRGWFWELDVGRTAYEDLAPVWRFVETHYVLVTTVGGSQWGYAIYQPRP